MDFNKRQYMRPVDFELFYYNDTELRSVASHHHDYCEFYFFLEGNVKYHIGNAIYKLSYGDCLLIPPGIPPFSGISLLRPAIPPFCALAEPVLL